MLKYSETECAWICSECGAVYGPEELARVFDYSSTELEEQKYLADKGIFTPCHCMDCGILWEEIG